MDTTAKFIIDELGASLEEPPIIDIAAYLNKTEGWQQEC
jgi:hypothetical protein